jgi:hypothetical protein
MAVLRPGLGSGRDARLLVIVLLYVWRSLLPGGSACTVVSATDGPLLFMLDGVDDY